MIGRLWREHRILFLTFLAAIALALLFAIRAAMFAIHWHGTPPNPPLAGWMTPRFVSHSWHVPPEVVGNALGLDQEQPRRVTLDDLATERGLPVEELIGDLQTAIDSFRAGK